MAVTVVIIALVMFVSLYEYFSAKSWQQVTSAERNDVVFEHRNQEYGAYKIRRDYSNRVIYILLGFMVVIGSAYGVAKYIQSIPEEVIEEQKIDPSLWEIPAPPPEEPVEPPPVEAEPPPPVEKSTAFVAPEVSDTKEEENVVLQEDLEKTKASSKTNDVKDDFVDTPPPTKHVAYEAPKQETIETIVDEDPVYPGGIGALIQYLGSTIQYPQKAVDMGIEGKAYIGFVVDKRGQISDVTVLRGVRGCSECDAEAIRVIKTTSGKWTAAKKNGVAVKSRYQVPINFKLQ
jgi:protein TonB